MLKGGRSLERQVSLKSGARVEDALERLGHEVTPIDVGSDLVDRLTAEQPEIAFIALHGRDGEDGTVQELLEVMGIPYTGSGVSACIRAADKVLAKHAMRDHGIPTPDFYAFNETAFKELGAAQALPAIEERLDFPIVVKPAGQGSALGIKFARTTADVPAALVAAFSYDRKVLLERYVTGRDLAVSIIEDDGVPRVLPIVEAVPEQEDFYDFEARYEIGRTRFVCPAELAGVGRRTRRGDRARRVCAARVLGLLPHRPDARRGDRRAVRARGELDPRTDRDEPASPSGGRCGYRVRPAHRPDPQGSTTMNIGTQREPLRRFFELRAAHTTSLAPAPYRQDAAVYTDPEQLAREERLLLRGRPLVAALSADVPSTGDCLATEVAGVPVLLIRGEDAEVRAFLNICRHRGGRVFTGRGRPGRALKCPYHSWAYDLNGDLLGQPLARDAFEPSIAASSGCCR